MITILVIVIGVFMMSLPYIKVVTLNDIMGGLGALAVIMGVLGWLMAEHISKE